MHRIAATALCIAADPEQSSSGRPWLLPDDGNVVRLDSAEITGGIYDEMSERARVVVKAWDAAYPKRPRGSF